MISETDFHDTMNVENAKDIFEAIKRKVAGKKFVFVAQNYGFNEQRSVLIAPCEMMGSFGKETILLSGLTLPMIQDLEDGFGVCLRLVKKRATIANLIVHMSYSSMIRLE